MDNFDKLHKDQDDFIKGVFQEDKIVSQPVLDSFETYLEKTKIKVDKYTHKQKKVIVILIVLLIISVSYNIFITIYPEANIFKNIKLPVNNSDKTTSAPIDQDEPNNESKTEVDDVVEINKNEITDNTNTIDNTASENENTSVNENITNQNTTNKISTNVVVMDPPRNNVTIANVTKVPEVEKDYSGEIDVEAFKDTLEWYSLGINRISYDEETLESNTILLAITKEFFNSHSNDGLEVGTKYTQSVENMHKFLKELTDKDLGKNPIQSYNNYIGFAQSTKSYLYGKDIKILDREDYKCKDLKFSEKHGDSYTATAKITRTLDYIDTVYDVEVEFKINKDYTYQQFNIISLKAKNTSFFPDNTVRLVD